MSSDQFTDLTSDLRATDPRHHSEPDDAVAIIDALAAGTGTSPWKTLDRADIANRLRDIVQNPRLLDQGRLNLCGPACFASMWCGRDPVAFATFAREVFETGRASIGRLVIEPDSGLLEADPSTMDTRTEAADWMVLGAIRNSEDAFWQGSWRGDPSQQIAGITLPEEVAAWMTATGDYASVSEEANWISLAGLDHATSLTMSPGTDVALLINANMLTAARVLNASPPASQPHSNFLLDMFPNHFVVALNVPTVAVVDHPDLGALAGDVVLSVWTWGADKIDLVIPQDEFVDNYFGAVIGHLA